MAIKHCEVYVFIVLYVDVNQLRNTMKSFTATAFQRKPADIFNAVQADSAVVLESNSRPAMVIMLKSDYDKITKFVMEVNYEKSKGDSKSQLDLLKG